MSLTHEAISVMFSMNGLWSNESFTPILQVISIVKIGKGVGDGDEHWKVSPYYSVYNNILIPHIFISAFS